MADKIPLVSIVIVNWNGEKYLRTCLNSVYNQEYRNIEVILVDNASSDGSVTWVKNHYPLIKIIKNNVNEGFAEANNIGYNQTKGEYVLFLNNDTKVTKNFLTELMLALRLDFRYGAMQPKILLLDSPSNYDSIGAFLTPTGFLYHYGFGKKDVLKYDKDIDLFAAKGACMLFRKSVLESISVNGSIFDPDFFAYFEETDLCHRVWLAGYRIGYAHKSIIYHKLGATSKNMNNAFIQYHSFKNRIRSLIKNLGIYKLIQILPVHILLCELYSGFSLINGNISLFLAIQRSFLWNTTHIIQSLKLREFVQRRIRCVDDDLIFRNLLKFPSVRYYLGLPFGRIIE